MKSSIFALLIVLLSFYTHNLHAGDVCSESLSAHIQEIEVSENYLKILAENANNISQFEITQMQKSMTKRFKGLKNFIAIYDDDKNNCSPKVLSSAVAVYDFSRAGKSILAHTILRRVFLGFIKYPRYELSDYINSYKKYTSNELIERVTAEINNSKVSLPQGVVIHKNEKDYDPNLYLLSDAAIKGTTSVVASLARVWGFISDNLKWREGRIKNNHEATKLLREKLKPLDLVYEKREFRLSNYTIPGHFGHVGIWLGTKEELMDLGIWDKEFFAPFREYVEAGQNIFEIRKEGIGFQSIDTFINLDEIAVTRIRDISERADSIFSELSEQIGKHYDFRFDARSADKITCAELVAFSYGDIKWPQTKTLFLVNLRPDDLAVLTLEKSSPAEFVLYLKGIKEKDGGGFESKNFEEWSKIFKAKDLMSKEEINMTKDKKLKNQKEKEEFQKMYNGA